jgi:hypothetical protein
MSAQSPTDPPADQWRSTIVGEVTGHLMASLRNLHRLHGGDRDAVARNLAAVAPGSVDSSEEPIVIKVESFGLTELVTLREYIFHFIQDREIGLEEAREVLGEAPGALLYNRDDFFDHPEFLQLHSAIDPGTLAAEIERLDPMGEG